MMFKRYCKDDQIKQIVFLASAVKIKFDSDSSSALVASNTAKIKNIIVNQVAAKLYNLRQNNQILQGDEKDSQFLAKAQYLMKVKLPKSQSFKLDGVAFNSLVDYTIS